MNKEQPREIITHDFTAYQKAIIDLCKAGYKCTYDGMMETHLYKAGDFVAVVLRQ